MKLFSKIRGLRPDGHDLVVQADLARDSRNWPLAAELYRKALERQPKNSPIWIQYGHALTESGHLGEAEDAYRRSLADAPDVADSHLQLGHVLKLQGRTAEAENAYLRAFELDPMLPHPLTELSALGWSERRLSELRRPVEARRSSCRTSADAAQATHADATSPASLADQRTVEDTSQRLPSDLRRQIGEILGIDLRWVARRHPAIHSLSGVATATPDARRRLLQRAGVDFSPFVSVRRMCEQFPDYDFSSGAALIDFIEQRLPASKRVSPHWLYDEKFYSSLYSGSDNSEWARYFGFLLCDTDQARRTHRLFSPHWYAGRHAAAIDSTPAFFHFLRTGVFEDLSPSPLFDPEFYRAMYPQVSACIADGKYSCSLEHFIFEGADQGLLPSADWDPDYYLAQNPDVAEAVRRGFFRSPFNHWIHHGIAENRAPNAQFDSKYYLENYPSVAREIKEYNLLGPFEHFAGYGRPRCWRARAPLHTLAVPIEHAKALYLKRCELAVFRVRNGAAIRFAPKKKPFFSVIIPAHNNFAYNIRILELLEHAAHYSKSKLGIGIEVVVVNNDSSDETIKIPEYVQGIIFQSVSPNVGFPRACNLGASLSSGTYLVFMNNDVEFEPDIFVRLHQAIQKDKAEVACFGATILQFDGTIQDLGSGIWRDGVAQNYFRNQVPTRYSFAYPRDVDYVAGCFFCISAAEFENRGGFDERYSPGYYEESDLCLRLWKDGRRSRVYPEIIIYHLEFGSFSSGTTSRASAALMIRNRALFAREHRELLMSRPAFLPNGGYSVQHDGVRPSYLFIEDRVPSARSGSGYGRSEILLRKLLHVADVEIFACYRESIDWVPQDFQYLEITYGPEVERLRKLLSSRHYDAIYVCRAHNLRRYREVLQEWKKGGGKVVFDTEAIAAVLDITRLEGAETYAEVSASPRLPKLVDDEFRCADLADVFISVNDFEAAILQQRFNRPVYTIGHYVNAQPLGKGPTARSGLLFVGALYDAKSPNYDSLVWFLDHVWPRIRAARPEETLRIAGFVRAEVSLRPLLREGVTCLGQVEDLTSEYQRARVFIAPTRFAAGIPFKVHEALSHGLPVVLSQLLAEQLASTGDSKEAVLETTVNDAGECFAEACLRLLRDDALWLSKRKAGLEYVRQSCAPELLDRAICTLVRDLHGVRPLAPSPRESVVASPGAI